MRRIIGLLAILMGVAGAALLAAGGVAAWRAEWVVVDRTDQVTARAAERLVKIEARLRRLEGKVKDFTVDVGAVRTAAARLVERAVKDAAARTEVRQLLDRLDHLLERSEELGETLDVVARLFEDTADLNAQFDGNPARSAGLNDIADTLEQAAAALAGVRKELSELRLPDAAPDPQKLSDLAARSRGPLERLAGGVASIRQYSADARESLDRFRQAVRYWARLAAAAVTLVCVWFGLGQLCLIGWGWKRLRGTPAGGPGGASK